MLKSISRCIVIGLAVVFSCSVAGCGGGSQAAGSRAYLGTQAPGDVWRWTITNGTFTATNQTSGFNYSGTVSTLATGFMKLDVQSTTDPNVTAGQSAYAVELPGTALVLKAAGADTKPPIFASSLGANPPGPSVTFNFVDVPKQGWVSGDEAYGYVTFTVTGNDYTGPTHPFALDGTALAGNTAQFTGANGLMTTTNVPGGGSATGAMTPSGVCVLDYGVANGGTIGVKQPAAPVDLSVLGSKSYVGFLVNSGKTQCVSCTPNGDGTLHGTGYANPAGVETGTSDGGSGVTVTFVSQPNPGLVKVSIATTGGTETLVGCVNQVNGKYMLFGFGAGTGAPYNIVLVEQ